MREGMQIQDKDIPAEDKIRLLDKISEIGVQNVMVGSFVSPRYTPQMRNVEEVVAGFTPRQGVRYSALIPNERGRERAAQFADRLTMGGGGDDGGGGAGLTWPQCDVFERRNWNRTAQATIDRWPDTIERAKQRGVKEAGIGLQQAWGSNFTGPVPHSERMEHLRLMHKLWDDAGIKVTRVSFADPVSYVMPHEAQETTEAVLKEWPEITSFNFHLHNARGMAVPTVYAILNILDSRHTFSMDCTLGGIGGCPYCGNGRATGMAPLEDLVSMFEDMGIETGIDLTKTIEAVWMMEEILGYRSFGHVANAGPRPNTLEPGIRQLYDMNIPFVETFEEAKHFLKGKAAFGADMVSPWDKPIESEQRVEIEAKMRAAAAAKA
jgi:hydroxymethylglutaryl-CoA lyase